MKKLLLLFLFLSLSFAAFVPAVSSQHVVRRAMYPTAGGTIVPTDVAGLYQWLKADAITGKVDGDSITVWNDSSGNGRNATGSGGSGLVYKTNIVNSLPIVSCVDGNGNIALGNYSALTSGEVFFVVKVSDDPALSSPTSGLWTLGTNAFNARFPFTDGIVRDDFGSDTRYTVGDPTPSLSSTFRIYNVWSATNDWAANLDGANLLTQTPNTVAFPSAAVLGVSVGGDGLDGYIAEYIMYDRKLSSGNRAGIVLYLQTKYGL